MSNEEVKNSEVNIERQILAVTSNDNNGTYKVSIPQGSSVAEVAFAVAVVSKCLVRDKVIKDNKEFIDLVTKYCTDPQYGEVKGDK
mgnify:CR=1 FL=1